MARDAKGQVMCTTTGEPVADVRAKQTNETGQHDGYVVLCPDERAKGFVRPYRDAYQHVGLAGRICGKPKSLTEGVIFCSMEPGHDGECVQFRSGPIPVGCRTVTTMGRDLSETYARDPSFYGATFCCGCNRHLPVSEFVWTMDGQVVGS
jgi:hypothetical protein